MVFRRNPIATIVIGGPTASGKSQLALELAEALGEFGGAAIINADSMQVYSELRIVTGRPSEQDEARAPHHLYGTIPAREACSAGRWRSLAAAEIAAVQASGRIPLVVGGTGLYLKVLTEGLAEIPTIPEPIRAQARARFEAIGVEGFHAELAVVDPAAAEAIAPGDSQRLVRAWEVLEATGDSLMDWQARGGGEAKLAGPAAKIVLGPPRDQVYARIYARVAAMAEAGAVDEVRALRALDLPPGLPVHRAVGVPEFGAAGRGDIDVPEAVQRTAQASRRLAKRQTTWFRHQTPGWEAFSAQHSERFFDGILPFVRQFLLTLQ